MNMEGFWPDASITKHHSLQESSHTREKVDCTRAVWWFTPYLRGEVITHALSILSEEAHVGFMWLCVSQKSTWNGPWMFLKHFSSKRWALSASPSSSQPIANIPLEENKRGRINSSIYFVLAIECKPCLTHVMAGPWGSVTGSYISRSFFLISGVIGNPRG